MEVSLKMTSIEQTGKNVDEATQLALEKLGVTEDQVDVEILDEGAKGFLGIKQSPAVVRVTVKKQAAPYPEARPEPRRAPRQRKPRVQEAAPKPEKQPRPAPVKKEAAAPAPAKVEAAPAEEAEKPATRKEDIAQTAERAREVLQRILDGIGMGGTATVKNAADGRIQINIAGGDSAVLIGKHGQTIDSLQYLVSVIVNRHLEERVRISFDVEGYRERREEALRQHAIVLAKQVKESGQEAVLEPLHANERRVVHTALADDPDVYTYSEGTEPERYVVISPKK
jgi:spoIIIJ-associated protein